MPDAPAVINKPLGMTIKRWLIRGSIGFLLLTVLGLALWTWVAMTYVYSAGERAGYVQKFSKRGWVIKTWEGELAMVNLPGTAPEIFTFSVRDEAAAKKIQETMGLRVNLSYQQHKGLPGNLFGDTSYFVTNARRVDESLPPASPAAH